MAEYRVSDRRVQRTRALLHGALVSLVHEKPYGDIVVKEILARADVGRSTFYAHYRDKDELLECGIRELLRTDAPNAPPRSEGAVDWLLRFSQPFLAHAERFRDEGERLLDAERSAIVHEHLRRVLESRLADELRAERRRRPARIGELPVELLARHLAATFVLALAWWVEHPSLSARDVDVHFRALVEPALREA
jgi:AcrR family transcriptional regulator